jgi:hypothetical protein
MKLRHLAIFVFIFATALASNAKVCKYTGPKGENRYSKVPISGKAWSLVECWGDDDEVQPEAADQTDEPAKIGVGVSPLSILPQCLDPGHPSIGSGSSARARECTRQYCGRKEYQALIEAYAMGKAQSMPRANRHLPALREKKKTTNPTDNFGKKSN